MPPELVKTISQIGMSLLQHGLNRSDYNYTHQMQAAPQQVKEMRDAGLNPALAYGQLSPAGGESLGNTIPQGVQGNESQERKLMQQQIETSRAQQQYYEQLAYKTGEEGQITEFNRLHQEEMYQLEFNYKGLLNDKTSSEVRDIRAGATLKELESELKRIDLRYADQEKAMNLRNIIADTSLKIAQSGLFKAQTRTENALRDVRLREIQQNILNMIQYRSLLYQETNLARKRGITESYNGLLAQTSYLYQKYLTSDNKDWSKLEARAKWSIYSPAISQGINTAINSAVLIGTRGLSGFLGNSVPQVSNEPTGYGPGRDHLGH